MKKGKTTTGFEFIIADEVLDDWELVEMFTEIDDGNPANIVKAAKRFLGDKQLNALKEHLRDENGKVSTKAMVQAIAEIIHSEDEVKN